MSSMDCTDPNHQKCESCGGCIPCGCLCHLCGVGDDQPDPEAPEDLTVPEMGLQRFDSEQGCPKCGGGHMKVEFHEMPVIRQEEPQHPCVAWARKGILTGPVGEHLCLTCLRCGYGRPTATVDAA